MGTYIDLSIVVTAVKLSMSNERIKQKISVSWYQYTYQIMYRVLSIYTTTQNLLRITLSFNDLMLKTNRLKTDFFYKDRLIFGLDDPVANMSIRHVYYA